MWSGPRSGLPKKKAARPNGPCDEARMALHVEDTIAVGQQKRNTKQPILTLPGMISVAQKNARTSDVPFMIHKLEALLLSHLEQ